MGTGESSFAELSLCSKRELLPKVQSFKHATALYPIRSVSDLPRFLLPASPAEKSY